jgi:hypothetical protein
MKPKENFAAQFMTKGPEGGPSNSIRPAPASTLQTGRASNTESEWGESLASAILHLVGAYKAMETLSASTLRSGAPDSFELASHCLCAALVTLDACLARSVD